MPLLDGLLGRWWWWRAYRGGQWTEPSSPHMTRLDLMRRLGI